MAKDEEYLRCTRCHTKDHTAIDKVDSPRIGESYMFIRRCFRCGTVSRIR